MTAIPSEHGWSEDALFAKALIYVDKMEETAPDDWEYGFWSSLSLEFICRAAVAHVSPTLLADRKDWKNIYYALGNASISKVSPKSANTGEVIGILAELVPGFTDASAFCSDHVGRRNAELHSGDLEFKDLETGKWLPKYYSTCKMLIEFMGKSLSDLFKNYQTAEELISASQDKAAKAVGKDVATHTALWASKTPDEQVISSSHSASWATPDKGHRAKCPACSNTGLVRGIPQGAVTTKVDDEDAIIQKRTVIPTSFECVACGLKILGLSKLAACGLGNTFTTTSTTSPAEYFGLYTEDDMEEARASLPEYEEDNNE